MRFSDLIGNDALKASLVKMVESGRTPHALLFVEQEGMGAAGFAVALSQYLNCKNHVPSDFGGDSCGECPACRSHANLAWPDLHFAFPVNATASLSDADKKRPVSRLFMAEWNKLLKSNPYFSEHDLAEAIGIENKAGNISVNEAKEISDTLSMHAYDSDYKVMVIWLPEKMNMEASNKLLKLLEEPQPGTLFILVTRQIEKLLSTIVSRCQIVRLQPMEQYQLAEVLAAGFELDEADAMSYANLAAGSYGRAKELISGEESFTEADELLRSLLEEALKHSLAGVLAVSENLTGLGKEAQRRFCIYAENYIRKIFMMSENVPGISYTKRQEEDYIKSLAARIKPTFYQKIIGALDTAIAAIDGNVLAKLVFTDLCNRFYLYI
ncbi:MAG: hypothetical protein KBT44_04665 [Bacteroidales bacterium]|nr:hypothetical protein [Candidatus Equibacterium intestinale]